MKRALVIAAPVAATAAVAALFVVGVTQLDLGGGDDDAGEAARRPPRKAPATAAGSTRRPRRPRRRRWRRRPEGTTFVQFTQGPPAEIVRLLEGEGIEAEVEPGGGVIAEARAGEVRAALAGRATGDVPVYVR